MIGGIILLSRAVATWATRRFVYLFAWLIIIGSLKLRHFGAPHCKSAYFVRRFIYKGWPLESVRSTGLKSGENNQTKNCKRKTIA